MLKKKISTKERRASVVASRLFLFGVVALWVLLFLAASVVLFGKMFEPIVQSYFIGSDGIYSSAENLAIGALEGWYIVTVVMVGIYASLRAFKLVGKWEPKGKKDEHNADNKD